MDEKRLDNGKRETRSARHRRDREALNRAAQAIAVRAAANAQESIKNIAPAVSADERAESKDVNAKEVPAGAERGSRAQFRSERSEGGLFEHGAPALPASRDGQDGTTASETPAKQEKPQKRRWPGNIARALIAVFAIAALVLLCSEIWLFNNWAALSVDEIMYHLRASLSGTNTSTIVNYVSVYGVIEAIGAILIIGALVFTRRRCRLAIQRIAMALILAFGIGATVYAIGDFNARIGLFDYLAQLSQQAKGQADGEEGASDDFVEANYVDPAATRVAFPKEKRNLVFIYLESVELTFTDEEHGGVFSQNVLPELTELAAEGECFAGTDGADGTLNGGYALPGTTWTTGAMFGTTSGAPLKLPFNSMELSSGDDFFPTMITLGDILAEEGYAQELLIGSEAAFGGRDLLYSTHGDFTIFDYSYAIDQGLIPKDYFVWWGFEDEKLFAFARDEITRLAAGDEPFNLTLLTVDTHFPDGWKCRLCENGFSDQYSNVYACSSRQVAEFVRWIQQQDFYENTTIILMGDHPTMDADYCTDIPADYGRRVLTAILNPSPETLASFDASARREYSTMDMFPTTLSALGAYIGGNRLGLGVNLFSDEPTLIERYGLETCEVELEKPSSFLEAFTDTEITAKHMANAAAWDWIDAEEDEDGAFTFTLVESALSKNAVNDVKITVHDRRTDFSRAIPTTVSQKPSDPNVFFYTVHTNLTEDDLPYLTLTATVSAGRFKNYEICEVEGADLLPEEDA